MDGAFDRSAVESSLLESEGTEGTGAVNESKGTGAMNESLGTPTEVVEEMEGEDGLPESEDTCCLGRRRGRKLGGLAKGPRVVAGKQL